MSETQKRAQHTVYKITTYGTATVLVGFLLMLIITSIIVRDKKYPVDHPVKFTIETLSMGFIATLPFLYLFWSRTGHIGISHMIEYVVLVLKFAGLHLLFQFAGIYSILFG